MSDFKAKVHQIVCRLSAGGAYSASLIPGWILEGLLLRGRDERGAKWKGRGVQGRGRDRERTGQGRPQAKASPQNYFLAPALKRRPT